MDLASLCLVFCSDLLLFGGYLCFLSQRDNHSLHLGLFLVDLWSQLDEIFFQLFYDDVSLGKSCKALLKPCNSYRDILLLSLELGHEGVHQF